jgi:transposase
MIRAGFLSDAERKALTRIARDGLEEHRVARRANSLILLDRGWSCEEVAEALMLDDDTVRTWYGSFKTGGADSIHSFEFKGGSSNLTAEQIEQLRAWATKTLPGTTREIGHFIRSNFGHDYTRSAIIKLMNRLGFEWRKPKTIPLKITIERQEKFIASHDNLRDHLLPDEAVLYADAVHPTHQSRPAGCWAPKDENIALRTASGRDRMNIHGAIDLETGVTVIKEVLVVDALSTIALLEAIERAYPHKSRIHLYLDNAAYHHAKLVRDWLSRSGRRIVLHFVPAYCAHLNPIERLWGVMHHWVSRNKCYETFREYADAILHFLKVEVPRRFEEFSSRITDNFRVIDPKDFRIVG